MKVVEQHVAYWCRRFPGARPHRDDIRQEAALAFWLATATFDGESASLNTHAWHHMRVAVRRYLVAAGVLRRHHGGLVAVEQVEPIASVTPPDVTCGPLERKQAWALLRGGWEAKGFTTRQAEALSLVEVGATFQEAGRAVGVSRQAVEQVAKRAGVQSPFAWREAA